jgi:hypothetical protein
MLTALSERWKARLHKIIFLEHQPESGEVFLKQRRLHVAKQGRLDVFADAADLVYFCD